MNKKSGLNYKKMLDGLSKDEKEIQAEKVQ